MEQENKTQENFEENLFDKMSNVPEKQLNIKQLERSRENVVIAGVCSGVANYFNTEPANIRVVALLSLILGGWSVAAYSIMAFLTPLERTPHQLSDEEKAHIKKENFRTVLSGLLILTGLHFALLTLGIRSGTRIFLFSNYIVFPIGSILIGIFLLTHTKFEQFSDSSKPVSRFLLSRSDKFFLGVCGGLAKYIGVDSSFLRIIFIIASFLTLGLFALLYLITGLFAKLKTEINFD